MSKSFSELKLTARLHPLRRYIRLLAIYSLFYNLVLFTPALYMLNVRDHAIANLSVPTLVVLTILLVIFVVALGFLNWVRESLIERAAALFFTLTSESVFSASFKQSALVAGRKVDNRLLQDVQMLKRFIGSKQVLVFFDVPFTPLFVAMLFVFHVYFGVFILFGVVLLLGMTYLEHKFTKQAVTTAGNRLASADNFLSANLINAEAVESMGMTGNVRNKWSQDVEDGIGLEVESGSLSSIFNSISGALATLITSCTLGLGGYLVIHDQITAGLMIAAMILAGRTLAPLRNLLSGLESFQSARDRWSRLADFFELLPPGVEPKTKLPPPLGALAAKNAFVTPLGQRKPILSGVTFLLPAGAHLGIMGESGAGKSTLAKACLGLLPCQKGSFRLDGVETFGMDKHEMGRHIGYLPQEVRLIDGSVADNISRFSGGDSQSIVEAAKFAGVHELILTLPRGYDTLVTTFGAGLSAGQMQRIGLARAVYGSPSLVVLDEPNSNLDIEGEGALIATIKRLKAINCSLLVVAHNVKVLSALDNILVLKKGRIAQFDRAEAILSDLLPTH